MNITLESRFTAELMSHWFPDIPKLQEHLNTLTYDRARRQTGKFSAMSRQDSAHADIRMKSRKKELEAYIPAIKVQIENSRADASNLDDLKHDLYMKERELESIKKEMEKFTAKKAGKEWMTFGEKEAAVQLIDQLALHFIDWFKEGHLGPGTVEYNGVKYTVK